MSMTITGQRQLAQRVEALRQAVASPDALEDAAESAALVVRDEARRLAPRSKKGSHGKQPGHLSRNIDHTVRADPKIANARVGPNESAWYGMFPELGHPRAQPFLRPAFDTKLADALRAAGNAIAKRIRCD